MRCGRCGNENADTNRFCGMCGAPLVAAPTAQPVGAAKATQAAQPVSGSSAPAPARPEVRHSAPRPASEGPIITGPSFLGLNKPAASSGRSGSLRASEDQALDHLRSSRNLDYLLEDEEEPKRGFGKALLILIALALAVGFGYIHWKQGGFDWLTASAKKPATAQSTDGSQPSGDTNPATEAASPSAAPSSAPPASSASGTTSAATPADAGGSNTSSPSANPAAPAASAPAGSASPGTGSGGTSSAPAPSAPATPSTITTAPAAVAPTQGATPQKADGDAGTPQAASPAENTITPADNEATAKPMRPPKPTPAKPVDPVAEAEKYIYGRGVRQNCDRGLAELKPAAEHSNPKAMISLGALYATGVCAPRDLPTAYRWFALALRKEPDNQPLQDNLQRIWSQMTQPERQLAIQLSQ